MVTTMATSKAKPPVGHQLSEKFADPDLVERIFEYIIAELPEIALDPRLQDMKDAVRSEYGGRRIYVPAQKQQRDSAQLADEVMRLFNGRNATEVARSLKIGRATVYRLIKRPGRTG